MANAWIRVSAFGFVGVAAILSGGVAGWALGIVLLVIATVFVLREVRRLG